MGQTRRNQAQIRGYLVLGLVLIFLFYASGYATRVIKPNLAAMAEVRARSVVTQIVTDSVAQCFEAGSEEAGLLVIKTDQSGKISMVESNTVRMNQLVLQISQTIQNKFNFMQPARLKVPLGTLMGSQLFSQAGPDLTLKVLPITVTRMVFLNTFTDAGINQTKYQVYLEADTLARVMVPFLNSTISVTTQIPVIETIVVGDVPNSYLVIPEEEVGNIIQP